MVDEILIAEDRKSVQSGNEIGELKVVESVDEKGNVTTKKTSKTKMVMDGLFKTNVDTHSDPLVNFMKNFLKSYRNIKNYNLYKVKVEDGNVKKSVDALQKMLENPSQHKAELKEMRVNPYDFKEKQTVTPELEAKLGELGLSIQELQNQGQFDKLLKYQFTDVIYITTQLPETGESITHQARIALRSDPVTQELSIETRAVRNQLDLDQPFVGMEFTEADKEALRTSGNLGRLAELVPNEGEPFKAFVSVDPQTNTLVYQPARDVRFPRTIGGKELTDQEFELLANGYYVPLEGLKSKNGKEYNAIVQYNAEKKALDFTFPGNRNVARRQDGIPNSIGGVELTAKQQNALANGMTLYIKGLTNRKTGDVYNSYISFNKDTGRLNFSRFNPNKSKETELQQKAREQGVSRQTKTTQTVNTAKTTTIKKGI